ncbi:MAG: C40 family peptidase [Herbaspirillum sp.]
MLSTAKNRRHRRRFSQAGVLATCFWFCGTAWSVNSSSLQHPPGAGKADVALATFHDITHRASGLAIQALSMLGIDYRYGGASPETGLDCSGLVRYVFREAWGTDLPRTSAEISRIGKKIDRVDLRPGDLVFYNTLRSSFSHVGIYLGDRKFIHSSSTGGKVRIDDMDMSYWKKRFNGARRIAADGEEQN